MSLNIITSGEKKRIVKNLEENFGIEKLPYLFLRSGKGKIRFFSGSLSLEEMKKIALNARVEFLGLYALREEKVGYRISNDALFLFDKLVTKNIIELNEEQAKEWSQGKEVFNESFSEYRGLVALKHKNVLIGISIAKEGKLLNFVPKERRTKQ